MIKRTLHFGNPCYLKKKDMQMVIEYPGDEPAKSVPIEDVGVVVIENQQITVSSGLLMALMENNAAILTCNWQHLPEGLLLPMAEHHAFTENVRYQIEASEPLRKNLWQQTIKSKIKNQAGILNSMGLNTENMDYWASSVKSGDTDNMEGRAAAYYWKSIFEDSPQFKRRRYGEPPNNLLNYGYSILRGVVARSLVAGGMMTYAGIHHRNKYNPYCLADDIMEPYRPYVDKVVLEIIAETEDFPEKLSPDIKRKLLVIPAMDITISGQKSPLMVGVQRTTASLMQCFKGDIKKIVYPELN